MRNLPVGAVLAAMRRICCTIVLIGAVLGFPISTDFASQKALDRHSGAMVSGGAIAWKLISDY